jgi:hypothetical protein
MNKRLNLVKILNKNDYLRQNNLLAYAFNFPVFYSTVYIILFSTQFTNYYPLLWRITEIKLPKIK